MSCIVFAFSCKHSKGLFSGIVPKHTITSNITPPLCVAQVELHSHTTRMDRYSQEVGVDVGVFVPAHQTQFTPDGDAVWASGFLLLSLYIKDVP